MDLDMDIEIGRGMDMDLGLKFILSLKGMYCPAKTKVGKKWYQSIGLALTLNR
jgi:hypothetical protein